MAEKTKNEKETVKKEELKTEPRTEKSQRLVSYNEFFSSYPLRAEHKARIKMEQGEDLFKTREEWLEITNKYQ